MRSLMIAATAAAVALPMTASPAAAAVDGRREIRQEQRECQRELRRADSRREYRQEQRECRREVSREQREWRSDVRQGRREALRDWRQSRRYDWNRFEPGSSRYYADRYYRDGRYYADRRLSYGDRVYRGYDGRYYCRRDDGTTGLIVGAGLGALLGNRLNIGGSATLSTILGGVAGAAIGQQIDRGGARCD